MQLFLALTLLASASADFDKIVAEVNAANAGWTAEAPTDRFGSMEDVKTLCGTWMPGHANYTAVELPEYEFDENGVFADSMDWRTDADCSVIAKVRDQSACGSCWAFGSTETFEGRRCVAGKGNIEFSSDDTAGCCSGFACGMSMGCNGGQPTAALKWMAKKGIVTGGDFYDKGNATAGGCKPYELQPCAHHVPATSKYPACPSAEYSIKCTKSCESAYSKTYEADKVADGKAAALGSPAAMIAAVAKGPLSVAFTVYGDFPTYKTGVYKHVSGSELGGHAVSVIGYGTESGTDYWLVKNSWNEQWGDNGTFKIVRGTNECGIESQAAAIDF
jgi:cathepsin B